MKRHRNTYFGVLLAVILVVPGSHVQGQTDFEGKVSYKISYTEIPAEMKGYEFLLPSETITYLKSRSSRTVVEMPMGGTQTMIYDADSEVALMLMDILGSKTAVPFFKESMGNEEDDTQGSQVVYFDEYKIICGYVCQKAQVKSRLPDGTVIVADIFYTNELRNNTQIFGDLQGLPLEYSTQDNGVHSTITASSVMTEHVPDGFMSLVIPEGYDVAGLE